MRPTRHGVQSQHGFPQSQSEIENDLIQKEGSYTFLDRHRFLPIFPNNSIKIQRRVRRQRAH